MPFSYFFAQNIVHYVQFQAILGCSYKFLNALARNVDHVRSLQACALKRPTAQQLAIMVAQSSLLIVQHYGLGFICNLIMDAPGHWWRCEQNGLSDSIDAFVRRLHCSQRFKRSGIKVRQPEVEQTAEEPVGPLLPGPDHYTWKRIVNRQRS